LAHIVLNFSSVKKLIVWIARRRKVTKYNSVPVKETTTLQPGDSVCCCSLCSNFICLRHILDLIYFCWHLTRNRVGRVVWLKVKRVFPSFFSGRNSAVEHHLPYGIIVWINTFVLTWARHAGALEKWRADGHLCTETVYLFSDIHRSKYRSNYLIATWPGVKLTTAGL